MTNVSCIKPCVINHCLFLVCFKNKNTVNVRVIKIKKTAILKFYIQSILYFNIRNLFLFKPFKKSIQI